MASHDRPWQAMAEGGGVAAVRERPGGTGWPSLRPATHGINIVVFLFSMCRLFFFSTKNKKHPVFKPSKHPVFLFSCFLFFCFPVLVVFLLNKK